MQNEQDNFEKLIGLVHDLAEVHRLDLIALCELHAMISDIRTRLDDLEQAMGEHYEAHSEEYPPEEYEIALVEPAKGKVFGKPTIVPDEQRGRVFPDHLERLDQWFR